MWPPVSNFVSSELSVSFGPLQDQGGGNRTRRAELGQAARVPGLCRVVSVRLSRKIGPSHDRAAVGRMRTAKRAQLGCDETPEAHEKSVERGMRIAVGGEVCGCAARGGSHCRAILGCHAAGGDGSMPCESGRMSEAGPTGALNFPSLRLSPNNDPKTNTQTRLRNTSPLSILNPHCQDPLGFSAAHHASLRHLLFACDKIPTEVRRRRRSRPGRGRECAQRDPGKKQYLQRHRRSRHSHPALSGPRAAGSAAR